MQSKTLSSMRNQGRRYRQSKALQLKRVLSRDRPNGQRYAQYKYLNFFTVDFIKARVYNQKK